MDHKIEFYTIRHWSISRRCQSEP